MGSNYRRADRRRPWKFVLLCILLAPRAFAAVAVKLVPILTEGLNLPVGVEMAPGDREKLYILEQRGRIVIASKGKLKAVPFLDIEGKVTAGGELGLLGLVFHPRFPENGRYFVNYTARRPKLTTIIAEYTAGKKEEREVLRFLQPYGNHNGGQLAFDAKGLLYIAAGDGGSGRDPHGNGQSKDTFLGKILRIDIDGKKPYGIPPDNPFAAGGGKKEIYAYGLRNPWRFSFDPLTGVLFAADVGQYEWEEIHVIEKGGNYGWNIMEGNHCHRPPIGCKKDGLIPPIFEYDHDEGLSITGGYVYRGKKIPELAGAYIYGDYGSGKIWALHYDQKAKKVIKNERLLSSHLPISSFGVDADGEILVVSHRGGIFRIAPK